MKRFLDTIRDIFYSYSFLKANIVSFNYIKFILKTRLSFLKNNPENFLSYKVYYPNRSVLFGLIVEIFFKRVYRTKCDKEAKFIIDCGANIGISVFYFRWCYPKAKILAFEPNPEAVLYLNKNVSENNLLDVNVLPIALGGNTGEVDFFVEQVMEASTGSSLSSGAHDKDNEKVVKVKIDLLSNYINQEIDFLKLDIEGAEAMVIEDLREKGKFKFIKEMSIEYHYNYLEVSYPLFKVLNVLKSEGFECDTFNSPMHLGDKKPSSCIINAWRNNVAY